MIGASVSTSARSRQDCPNLSPDVECRLARSMPLGENGVITCGGGAMTITKADLATVLHENLGINKREALELVMGFFEEISTALERGETVKLSGFGVFCLRDKNSRPGRNPKTGELIPVSARRVVMFHPSHILKALVQKEQPVATLAVSSREPSARERIEAEEFSPG
jgi:integration host factor subunit alpha